MFLDNFFESSEKKEKRKREYDRYTEIVKKEQWLLKRSLDEYSCKSELHEILKQFKALNNASDYISPDNMLRKEFIEAVSKNQQYVLNMYEAFSDKFFWEFEEIRKNNSKFDDGVYTGKEKRLCKLLQIVQNLDAYIQENNQNNAQYLKVRQENQNRICIMYNLLFENVRMKFEDKSKSECSYKELCEVILSANEIDGYVLIEYREIIDNSVKKEGFKRFVHDKCIFVKTMMEQEFNKMIRANISNELVSDEMIVFFEDKLVEQVEYLKKLEKLAGVPVCSREYEVKAKKHIKDFCMYKERLSGLKMCYMISEATYGKVDDVFYNSVKSMDEMSINDKIQIYVKALTADLFECEEVFAIDIEYLIKCLWYYAMKKPFQVDKYKQITYIIDFICPYRLILDVYISEFYYINLMDGNKVIREKAKQLFMDKNYSTQIYNLVASSLMWMGAYEAEKDILLYMLSNMMNMPQKLQERLHSLNNGGDKAPVVYEIKSEVGQLYFDVSSLSWKDEEYNSFFKKLTFEEKILNYALTVRDDDKELLIAHKSLNSKLDSVYAKIKECFKDEYGDTVDVSLCAGVALAGNDKENLMGIIVQPMECRQIAIFIHMTNIGKKVNIKFYTLFMPVSEKLDEQKQQVLSMIKKLSPTVSAWESSMKDNVLIAIQQLFNDIPENDNVVKVDMIEF